jgi:hypothetical protein
MLSCCLIYFNVYRKQIKMPKSIRNSNYLYDPSFYYFSKGSNHDDDND